MARRGYDVTVVHSLNPRQTGRGRLTDLAHDRVRGIRTGSLLRVAWMPIDPRVRMAVVERLDEGTEPPSPPPTCGWARSGEPPSIWGSAARMTPRTCN